jgi:hypothetical protein
MRKQVIDRLGRIRVKDGTNDRFNIAADCHGLVYVGLVYQFVLLALHTGHKEQGKPRRNQEEEFI